MAVILFLITLSAALLLLYITLFKGRFYCRHHSIIDVPIHLISDDLSHLTHWKDWLPWAIFDQNTSISYEYPNSDALSSSPFRLTWKSKIIKEGSITLEPVTSNTHYFHTLLVAPAFYPSGIHFNINLTKHENKTLIMIQIAGRLPFFKRWMRDTYTARANHDSEFALLQLLDYLTKYNQASEYKHHSPIFEWLPQTHLDKVDAVTRPFSVNNQSMSQKMDQGFSDLMTKLGPENPPAGPSFALYNKVDIVNHDFTGRLGIPIQNLVPCELCPDRVALPGYYLQLRYYGPYQNLPLAWYIIYSFMRLHNLKPNYRRSAVEVFEIGPAQTDNPKDYITLVCLPIK